MHIVPHLEFKVFMFAFGYRQPEDLLNLSTSGRLSTSSAGRKSCQGASLLEAQNRVAGFSFTCL